MSEQEQLIFENVKASLAKAKAHDFIVEMREGRDENKADDDTVVS